MKDLIHKVALQQNWKVQNLAAVHGGDINQAFCIETNVEKFFIKLNHAQPYSKMFEKEANGLTALQEHFPLKVPGVIAVGETDEWQYLILEWLHPATNNNKTWEAFGRALAQLHQTTNKYFGWKEDTYVASITEENGWKDNWYQFYIGQRILPLVMRLHNEGAFTKKDVQNAEAFCYRLEGVMPDEPPALLHGDLWSGNVMAVSVNGETTTAIYDPSVFYGRREIDIAMTQLFGGFPPSFYAAYGEIYPLQNGWQQRLPIFQLYPLLVHAVLFGGSYVSRVRTIMDN